MNIFYIRIGPQNHVLPQIRKYVRVVWPFYSYCYLYILQVSALVILFGISSCENNTQKIIGPEPPIEFNNYKLFEEPSFNQMNDFRFYFLAVSYGNSENTFILSIRLDSGSNSYGYYKTIDRDLMPPIGNALKTDTFPFIYSTTYFKLKPSDIDTLKMFIRNYQINKFPDTLQLNQFGGRSKEIAVFDNGVFYNIYRSYGSDASIEKGYLNFFDTVLKRFTPPPPVPSFRR